MGISLIEKWLSRPTNYNEGLLLYRKYGNNQTLLNFFETGDSYFTRKKLIENLTIIARTNPVLPPTQIVNNTPKPKIDADRLPDDLKGEYSRLGDIIREIAHLHGKLTVFVTDEERLKAALKITSLASERRSIYQRLDYFIANGKKMEVITPPVVSETENKELKKLRLEKELARLSSRRSKAKNKPHKQKEYNRLNEEIDQLRKELSND